MHRPPLDFGWTLVELLILQDILTFNLLGQGFFEMFIPVDRASLPSKGDTEQQFVLEDPANWGRKISIMQTTSFEISRMKGLWWKLISEIMDCCAALRLRSVFSTSSAWAWSVANFLQGLQPPTAQQDSFNLRTSGLYLRTPRTPHSSHRFSGITESK